jgi:prepilin-type processing-associated H-X9-DG protein
VVNILAGAQAARAIGVVDPRTGKINPLPKDQPKQEIQKPAAIAAPLRIVTRRHQISESSTTQQTYPVWVESLTKSENPRALVTADGKDASFVPGGAGVMFQSQNAYWFTPVLKIGKEAYLMARHAAERQVALSNAKQLGLAAIMFAQDNNEVLPSSDGIEAKLMPYVQNSALFSGFTYTFAGGALADISSTSETILGHVAGPGGRAVLYADGHAKWVNDGQ